MSQAGLWREQDDSEANVAANGGLRKGSPFGRTAHIGIAKPTSSAHDAPCASRWTSWVRHGTARIRTHPVRAPFPGISVDVVNAPGIGKLLTGPVGGGAAVGAVPGVRVEIGWISAEIIRG